MKTRNSEQYEINRPPKPKPPKTRMIPDSAWPKPSVNYDKTELMESKIMKIFVGCGILTGLIVAMILAMNGC